MLERQAQINNLATTNNKKIEFLIVLMSYGQTTVFYEKKIIREDD